MAKTEYEFYREERKNLIDAELEQASSFDKYILTLAAGTFGLSLLFIKDIVPHPEAGTIWLLVTAWAIFGASILSTLISFLLSQKAYREQRKILDNEYAKETKREQGEIKNTFATYTQCLNWASMILFLVGVIFLIIFSAVNLLL